MKVRRIRRKVHFARITSLLAALALCFLMVACENTESNASDESEAVVESFVVALKKGDIDEAKKLIFIDDRTQKVLDTVSKDQTKSLAMLWFSQVEVSFPDKSEISRSDSEMTISATFTAPDSQKLVDKIESQSGYKIEDFKKISSAEAAKIVPSLMGDALKGDLPKIEKQANVKLKKDEDGKWKIVPDMDFISAATGGIDKLAGIIK